MVKLTSADKAFIGSVRNALQEYSKSGCCSGIFGPSNEEKKTIAAIQHMYDQVSKNEKTTTDLRDTLALYEPTMEKALKTHFGSFGATSSRFDADSRLERMAGHRP